MAHKILIAGAGQLGSRYLQGLSKVKNSLDIFVFDPSKVSLKRSEERWREMPLASNHMVRFDGSLSNIPKDMDLAIISSTADVRAQLVKRICNQSSISNWILEKVLGQSSGEISQIQGYLSGEKSAWVNTPMYCWSLYQKIRMFYPSESSVDATFMGFGGLACNAIHFIDFVSRWSGALVTEIDVSGLRSDWYASKREGFYEIDGEMNVSFSDGSSLMMITDRYEVNYMANLKIKDDEWLIDESKGLACTSDGRQTRRGDVEYQSQLTAPLVEAIFADNPCGLPTLAESAQQHNLFLNTLLGHWNRNMPARVSRLPIT